MKTQGMMLSEVEASMYVLRGHCIFYVLLGGLAITEHHENVGHDTVKK